MKKFISFAAFALLASALTFSLAACSSDDDGGDDQPEVPDWSKLPEVPENPEQAKAMFVGQWSYPVLPSYDDAAYLEFRADGTYWIIHKIKADLSEYLADQWYQRYPGQVVGFKIYDQYTVIPDEDDPTQGTFKAISGGGAGFTQRYKNLDRTTLTLIGKDDEKKTLHRVWPHLKYKEIEEPR